MKNLIGLALVVIASNALAVSQECADAINAVASTNVQYGIAIQADVVSPNNVDIKAMLDKSFDASKVAMESAIEVCK